MNIHHSIFRIISSFHFIVKITFLCFSAAAAAFFFFFATECPDIKYKILNYTVLTEFERSHPWWLACLPLDPRFAGSNVASKNPQHTFLWRVSKAVGPMLEDLRAC
jgi:hypothetical protein